LHIFYFCDHNFRLHQTRIPIRRTKIVIFLTTNVMAVILSPEWHFCHTK
jgi:hypothetical protein